MKSQKTEKKPHYSPYVKANLRGIHAVRRKVSASETEPLMYQIAQDIGSELENAARIFMPDNLGVTVVGFSRFNDRLIYRGPTTDSMLEKIPSLKQPIKAKLGSLAIFGSRVKAKLAVSLFSDELQNEVKALEDQYLLSGFPLKRDYNDDGSYLPHCSIALLYNDHLREIEDPRMLSRLSRLAGLGLAKDKTITLEPVKFGDDS